ncbi:DUF2756 family protein [Trabulsiella odontotermitis]|uniref:DUF2756 family protein n=1 Tax=Trabulsiella odontotermitis TaxID=379893 RepID=UPI0024B71EB4|nr:DUF2756 family protein [Trabulsiella odontotermitis]WHP31583.1 DUF2756 family protein [Trabulsiella odontotermitis]
MKRVLLITALLPFVVLAQPLNTTNNPNQPGYQIPSQQRMQTQMLNQQQQQKGMLNQQLQTQTRSQQQHLQMQMNDNAQRVRQGQPREQVLPNTNGGMLNSTTQESGQQHMLPSRQNGDMLKNP